MLEHCARVTDCQDFALRLAAAQDLSMSGALALFVQTASTLGEALREICRYQHLHHAQPAIWRLEDLGNAVTFNVFLDAEELSPQQRRLAVDLAVGQGHLAVKRLTEGRVRPTRISLHSGRPKGVLNYRRFFEAPIEFNAEADGLILPAGALDVALLHPDPQMHEALRGQISSIAPAGEDSFLVQELRTIIRSLLPTGDYGLERAARCFACDKRTLQRYLREEADTTYQAQLDDVRFDVVKQYLSDSQMPMTQLTFLAGFTDPSNFARAFRKRFGMPPKQWREQHVTAGSPKRTRRPGLRGQQISTA